MRRGFNSKRAHLSVPALQTPPKFHEKTLRDREKKYENCGKRGKKSAKFWALHPSGPPPFGASTLRGPIFLGLDPTFWGHDTHQIQKWIGQKWIGPNWIGQSRSLPSCEAPAAPKPLGFHTTAREPKRGHLRVPAFKNNQNSTRRPAKRERTRTKMKAGEGKKNEILGDPAEESPAGRGPAEGRRGTTHNNTQQQTSKKQTTHNNTNTNKEHNTTHNNGLAKNGIGQKWNWPKLDKPLTTNVKFWPTMDWPKLAGQMGWPKMDWPKSALTERNWGVSVIHRPPTSAANTTNRALPPSPDSSG